MVQDKRLMPIDTLLRPLPADDPRPVSERLEDYAKRGIEAPDSLTLPEIKQMAFALHLLLALHSKP